MKRLCVLLIALAMVAMMVAPASATWTRVMTMGDQHMFIQDDYNIYQWTSTVNNYPRHLIIDHSIDAESYEFGSEDYDGSTRLGMVIPFLKSQVIGLFISDFDVDYPLAPSPFGEADHRFDLFWGWRGQKIDIGVRLDHANVKEEIGGTQSQSVFGLHGGVGINAQGNMVEINAFYRGISWTNETQGAPPNSVINEKDKGTDLGIAARYLYAYNSMVTLVPAIAFRTLEVAEKASGTSGDGTAYKTTGWDIGAGCNTVPLQGTEFLTSIGLASVKEEVTDTSSSSPFVDETFNLFPYIKFGTEIQVKNWLAMRFGAQKWFISEEDKIGTPTTKVNYAAFIYNVGASIMVGDLQFDVDVNPGWFNAGPYFLSGEDDGDMFSYISIKYDYR